MAVACSGRQEGQSWWWNTNVLSAAESGREGEGDNLGQFLKVQSKINLQSCENGNDLILISSFSATVASVDRSPYPFRKNSLLVEFGHFMMSQDLANIFPRGKSHFPHLKLHSLKGG